MASVDVCGFEKNHALSVETVEQLEVAAVIIDGPVATFPDAFNWGVDFGLGSCTCVVSINVVVNIVVVVVVVVCVGCIAVLDITSGQGNESRQSHPKVSHYGLQIFWGKSGGHDRGF